VSVPCPEIAVYRLETGPSAANFLSRYVVPVKNRKTGVDWFKFLPIFFEGPTYASVFNAAVDFWNDERAKLAAQSARLSALAESRRKAVS